MAYNIETNMFEGYIYKITNMINNKIYIGLTCQTINRRWSQHITNSKLKQSHSIIDTAIAKYGDENFKIDMVEKCIHNNKKDLIKKLKQLEKYYINKFKSSTKDNNYNITEGGECVSDSCTVAVDKYSKDGYFLNSYPSMLSATQDLGLPYNTFSNISSCCRGEKVTAYGFIWRYKGDPFDKYRVLTKTTAKDLSIDFYDLDGNFIQHYDHHRDAILDGRVKSISEITRVCNGNRLSCNGYVIRYSGDSFEKYNTDKARRKIPINKSA